MDVAFGGNFYAIVDVQDHFAGIERYTALDLIAWSPLVRTFLNDHYKFNHPDGIVSAVSHVLWTGKPLSRDAHARNAVFYGDQAIDRSPCGTGTSARMAQWHAQDKLKVSDEFIHESIIGSIFKGRVEVETTCGEYKAIIPSIEGWAKVTGYNTIIVDDEDPYAHGFLVR